jgi:DNA-binding transcriptional regulator LsrR (DeoR family)
MPKLKLYQSYAWLYRKYVVERMTEQQIAKAAGVSQPTIHNYLKQFKLKVDR